ncbi:hypothetical protein RHECNPAF_17000117 [Rhizobium etli CNPAF512]|nr:hypothetical protein RHECNPAF_17000117 [Rhizobium etli CNPAF512]
MPTRGEKALWSSINPGKPIRALRIMRSGLNRDQALRPSIVMISGRESFGAWTWRPGRRRGL